MTIQKIHTPTLLSSVSSEGGIERRRCSALPVEQKKEMMELLEEEEIEEDILDALDG